MVELTDAILPVLKKIQEDITNGFRETNANFKRVDTKLNIVVDAVAELQGDVVQIRKDSLIHLGLTTRHRLAFEELQGEVKSLSSRIAALEARS